MAFFGEVQSTHTVKPTYVCSTMSQCVRRWLGCGPGTVYFLAGIHSSRTSRNPLIDKWSLIEVRVLARTPASAGQTEKDNNLVWTNISTGRGALDFHRPPGRRDGSRAVHTGPKSFLITPNETGSSGSPTLCQCWPSVDRRWASIGTESGDFHLTALCAAR